MSSSVSRRLAPLAGWLGASVVALAVVPSYAAGPSAGAPAGECPYGVESPCVIVTVQDGTQTLQPFVIRRSDVLAPADGPGTEDYVVYRAENDQVPPQTCVGNVSTRLATLVDRAAGDRQVRFAEVLEQDGSRHVVSRGQLDSPSLPAIVCDYGNDTFLYLRSALDGNDLNGAQGVDNGQFFSGNQDRALYVTAHLTGDQLDPVIVTDQDGDEASVGFSAEGVPAGATYRWTFGDGDVSNSPSPTHEYQEKGGKEVGLEVSLPDGSFGNDDEFVSVGKLPSGPTSAGTTTSATPTATTTPTQSPSPTRTPTQDSTPVVPPTATTTESPTPTPTPTGQSSPTPTGAPGATGTGTGTAGPAGTGTQDGGALPPTDTTTPSYFLPPLDPIPQGGVVGVLLQAFDQAPGAAGGAAAEAVTSEAAGSDEDRTRIDPRLWLAFGILGLLAAGAASEGRGVNAWLRRRRPWARMTS